MTVAYKNVAIIGGNKEGLALLPIILKDPFTRLAMIADPNPGAMLFKLRELGYKLSSRYHIHVTTNLEDLKKIIGLNVIINATSDPATEKFLDDPILRGIEKLTPLSARLLWGVRVAVTGEKEKKEGILRHAALLTSLREIVDAVRLTRDRNELLSDILNLAIEATRAETGSIMLVSKGEDILRMEIAKGMDEEVVRKIKVKLGEGISGRVAKEDKPLMISGKAKDEDFFHLKERRRVQNALCAPLIVGSEVIGVVNVNSAEPGHFFTEDDLNFMMSLASLAAEVIEGASEYEQLRADAAKYALWKELETSMSSSKPIHKRLNMVCRKLSQLVQGLTSYIYLYDEDRKKLILKSAGIKEAPSYGALMLDEGEGFEGWVSMNAKDVFLVDRDIEGNLKRCYICMPMMAKGRLVGVFSGQFVSPQGMSRFTEDFLKDMISLVSDSIFEHRKIEEEVVRTRKMFMADEIGLEIFSMKDPKKVLSLIPSASAEILGCEGALLRLDQERTKNYPEVASFGLEKKSAREHFVPIETETIGEVLRKKDIVIREFSEDVSPYVRTVFSIPLLLGDGEVIGMLSLFNKTERDSPHPKTFTKTDIEVLSRLISYIEKSLLNVLKGQVEEEFTISPQETFISRVEEELSRATAAGSKLILATVRITGLKSIEGNAKKEFVRKLLGFIREKTARFNILTMLDDETIGLLYTAVDERVLNIFQKAIDMEAPPEFKKGIYYGYASFPKDGDSFVSLLSKAETRGKADFHKV